MIISVYDSTGAFTITYELDPGDTADVPSGGGYLEEEVDGERYYMVGGVLTARPAIVDVLDYSVPADGTTYSLFTLPANTTVLHEGKSQVNSSSENLQFKASILGEWEFEIMPAFPYIEVSIKVSAIAV